MTAESICSLYRLYVYHTPSVWHDLGGTQRNVTPLLLKKEDNSNKENQLLLPIKSISDQWLNPFIKLFILICSFSTGKCKHNLFLTLKMYYYWFLYFVTIYCDFICERCCMKNLYLLSRFNENIILKWLEYDVGTYFIPVPPLPQTHMEFYLLSQGPTLYWNKPAALHNSTLCHLISVKQLNHV